VETDVEDLSCEIYIDADIERAMLTSALAHHLCRCASPLDNIEANHYYILVYTNLTFDPVQRQNGEGAFWYYRFYLCVEAHAGQQRKDHVDLVSSVLTYCWAQGWPSVAICADENELPRRGGYEPGS